MHSLTPHELAKVKLRSGLICWAISASVPDVCRGMCKLRIVARMDFRAVGLTAGVYPQKNSVLCDVATRRGLN